MDVMSNLHRDLVLQGLDNLVNKQDVAADRQPDGKYEVTISTESVAIAQTLEVLRLLTLVSGRIYNSIDRAHTHHTSQEKVRELRKKEQAVAAQYWIYRDQGFGHRKAIEATAQISEVCQQMQWDKTEVGYCVKQYPREYFALNAPSKEVVPSDEYQQGT